MNTRTPKALCCVIGMLLPLIGHAGASLDYEAVFAFSLEELGRIPISSVTKTEQTVMDAPAMAFVVTHDDIRRRGYRDLLDVLRDLPGVFTVSLSSTEHFGTELFIRGLEANRTVMVLLDGKKINPPTGEPFVFLNQIPLAGVKQVEFSYAGSSSLYGADTVAGLINIVTWSGGEARRGHAGVTVGQHDTREAQFHVGHAFDSGWTLSLAGKISRSDIENLPRAYPELFGGHDVDIDARAHALHAKAQYQDLTLSYFLMHSRRNNSLLYLPDMYDYSGRAYWSRLDQFLALDYLHTFNDAWATRAILAHSRTRLDPSSSYRADFAGERHFSHNQFHWKGLSYKFAQELYYRTDPLQITSGADVEFFESTPKTDDSKPFLGFYRLHYWNLGLFSQADYRPADPWKFVAGVRYDHNSRFDEVWNPRLALVHTPAPGWRLRASWGKAYLAPAPHLAYDRWGDLYEGAFLGLANEELKPEKTDTFEVGADWLPTPRLMLRGNTFYIRGRNLFDSGDPEPLEIEGVNVFGVRTVNSSKSDIHGAQLLADWQATGWLRLDAHYTFTQGRVEDGAGQRSGLARMPRHLAQAHLTADYARWYGRLTANAFDHVTTGPANTRYQGDSIGGRFTLDVLLARDYDVGQTRARLALQVLNLFDQSVYKISAHDNFFAALPRVPQERRRINASLTVDF